MLSKKEQDELIEKTYESIYTYCVFRLSDKEAALDVTQDTFALMIEKADRLTNDYMKQWLNKVAENKCNAYLRKKKREYGQFRLEEMTPDLLNSILVKMDDRSFGVYYDTYQAIMMNHLSAKEAILCEMKFIRGLSTAEIAKILHIKESAVNTRVSRLKKKLEKIISENIPYI